MSTTTAHKAKLNEKSDRLLEIKLPDHEAHASAFMPIRWCIYKPLFDKIGELGFKRPHLFIVIRHRRIEKTGGHSFYEYTDTDAYIVPLKAMMCFINFIRPGENEVCAVVFEMNNREAAKLVRELQKRIRRGDTRSSQYAGSVFDENGAAGYELYRELELIQTPDAMERREIPKEMFAKNPPKWLDQTVKFFFGGRGRNQCAFRKRAIPSLLLAPFVILAGGLAKYIALLFLAVFGLRLNNALWRQFFSPLRGNPGHLQPGPSIWWQDKKGKFRFGPLNFFNPVVIPTVAAILLGVSSVTVSGAYAETSHPFLYLNFWESLGWACAGLATIGGLILGWPYISAVLAVILTALAWVVVQVFSALSWLIQQASKWKGWGKIDVGLHKFFTAKVWGKWGAGLDKLLGWQGWSKLNFFRQLKPAKLVPAGLQESRAAAAKKRSAKQMAAEAGKQEREQAARAAEREREQSRRKTLEAELAALTCRSEAMKVDVDALPDDKKTIVLRYNNFKRRVCKTYAV